MGINSSGVRQIAEAVGSGEPERVAQNGDRAATHLDVSGHFWCAACWWCSADRFRSGRLARADYAVPVALLSIAVFVSAVSDGQAALIQGLRRIADLARIRVLTALFGAALTLGLVYFFRESAIVPSLVGVAVITLGVSWWYRRKIQIPAGRLDRPQVRGEAGALLKLGFAFMASAVLTTGAAYAIRIIVRDGISLDAAGLYQSAWSIGGLYVGLHPSGDGQRFLSPPDRGCQRRCRMQSPGERAGRSRALLLAGPGVLATLTFAPLVLAMFYSTRFAGAVEPLRWICLGMGLRVIAWPMGYVILAKGNRNIFFWTEVAATVVHVGLAFVLVKRFRAAGRDDGVLRAVRLARPADLRHRQAIDRLPMVNGEPENGDAVPAADRRRVRRVSGATGVDRDDVRNDRCGGEQRVLAETGLPTGFNRAAASNRSSPARVVQDFVAWKVLARMIRRASDVRRLATVLTGVRVSFDHHCTS